MLMKTAPAPHRADPKPRRGKRRERDRRERHTIPGADLVTEDNAAQHFVRLYRDDLRFCHDTGAWLRWDETIWREDKTGIAFHWARKLARHLSENEDDRIRYVTSRTSFAGGVERFARHDPIFARTIEAWDRDPWLLGTPGGTVDLRTGLLRPSRPEEGITRSTSVAPADDAASCPRWLRFLVDATGGDRDLANFLQLWAGYCLTGETKEHALLFVFGPGGNGKTVFLNTLTSIMRDYAKVAAMETFTASHSERHPTDLAMLRGARLVTASETEEGRTWAETRIKQMTGGDLISARFMRQDFFTYRPQFKLTIIGNHKPVLRNVDDAARRRFNLAPFVHKPPQPDRDLELKLREEAPAILRWMIEGCLLWQKNGLVRPESVVAATSAYFEAQDLFGQWLEDHCDVDPDNPHKTGTSAELFASWHDYAQKAGEAPGSRKAFAENMERRGLRLFRTAQFRGYQGVRLSRRPDRYDTNDA